MELSKEDARAIWLQKYYFRHRFEFNNIVLEYPLPKKFVEYKESVIILEGGIYSPWIGFQSKEEYDYLADLSGIDWHLFFKKYWSLRFGNKISKEVIDFFDEKNFNDSYFLYKEDNLLDLFVTKAAECGGCGKIGKDAEPHEDSDGGVYKWYEWYNNVSPDENLFFFNSKEQIDEYIRKINEMINVIVEKSDSPSLLLK